MPSYDCMYLISKDEYASLKNSSTTSCAAAQLQDSVQGDVNGGQVNHIELGEGGKVVIKPSRDIVATQQKNVKTKVSHSRTAKDDAPRSETPYFPMMSAASSFVSPRRAQHSQSGTVSQRESEDGGTNMQSPVAATSIVADGMSPRRRFGQERSSTELLNSLRRQLDAMSEPDSDDERDVDADIPFVRVDDNAEQESIADSATALRGQSPPPTIDRDESSPNPLEHEMGEEQVEEDEGEEIRASPRDSQEEGGEEEEEEEDTITSTNKRQRGEESELENVIQNKLRKLNAPQEKNEDEKNSDTQKQKANLVDRVPKLSQLIKDRLRALNKTKNGKRISPTKGHDGQEQPGPDNEIQAEDSLAVEPAAAIPQGEEEAGKPLVASPPAKLKTTAAKRRDRRATNQPFAVPSVADRLQSVKRRSRGAPQDEQLGEIVRQRLATLRSRVGTDKDFAKKRKREDESKFAPPKKTKKRPTAEKRKKSVNMDEPVPRKVKKKDQGVKRKKKKGGDDDDDDDGKLKKKQKTRN